MCDLLVAIDHGGHMPTFGNLADYIGKAYGFRPADNTVKQWITKVRAGQSIV